MDAGDVTVVVCSYDGDDDAEALACLTATARQGHVLLVDMSSTERIAAPAARIEGVEVLRVPDSRGLGESRQAGVERSDTRYVAFLDSDAVPRPGWLAALRDAVAPGDVAVAGGPVLPVWPPGRRRPPLFGTAPAGDFLSMLDLGAERIDVPRVLPGNMAVDRELTGPHVFATELGRHGDSLVGAEEIEMMLRVRAAGARVVYEPAAAVDHHSKADRMSWRWMMRRLEAAGRDSVLTERRLEPLPRRMTAADRAFLAVGAPAYLVGRLRARRRA